jgi:hypothetical protein
MVLEADDEVICTSEPFIMPDRAAHPAPARWPPSRRQGPRKAKPADTPVEERTNFKLVVNQARRQSAIKSRPLLSRANNLIRIPKLLAA